MRKLALVVLLCLSIAPAAHAKGEILSARACGADGCVAIGKRVLEATGFANGPTRPAPFYRLRFVAGDERGRAAERWTLLYVPSRGLVRGSGGPGRGFVWSEATAESRAALARALRRVEPLPAARLPLSDGETETGALPPRVYGPPPAVSSGVPAWPLAVAALLAGLALVARRLAT